MVAIARGLPRRARVRVADSTDGYSRLRYRGQIRRGPLSGPMITAQSIALAIDELAGAHRWLVEAEAERLRLESRYERDLAGREMHATAAAKVRLALRLLAEVTP